MHAGILVYCSIRLNVRCVFSVFYVCFTQRQKPYRCGVTLTRTAPSPPPRDCVVPSSASGVEILLRATMH